MALKKQLQELWTEAAADGKTLPIFAALPSLLVVSQERKKEESKGTAIVTNMITLEKSLDGSKAPDASGDGC